MRLTRYYSKVRRLAAEDEEMIQEDEPERLHLDDSGDLLLYKGGKWRNLGPFEEAENRVPDELSAEYEELKSEYRDRVEYGKDYEDEGRRLWDER